LREIFAKARMPRRETVPMKFK